MKVVINKCYGGFSLSEAAYKELGLKWDGFGHGYEFNEDKERSNPKLVEVVEKLGAEANGRWANLRVVNIPDGAEYEIDEYDGIETIHEKHRSWG